VPVALQSGSHSQLETSGPVKACNGIALPLHTSVFMMDLTGKVTCGVVKFVLKMLSILFEVNYVEIISWPKL
jgi:hypothetical protein